MGLNRIRKKKKKLMIFAVIDIEVLLMCRRARNYSRRTGGVESGGQSSGACTEDTQGVPEQG